MQLQKEEKAATTCSTFRNLYIFMSIVFFSSTLIIHPSLFQFPLYFTMKNGSFNFANCFNLNNFNYGFITFVQQKGYTHRQDVRNGIFLSLKTETDRYE